MTRFAKTLGLIPARGGSKGIPRKNIRALAGKPLIAWTIEAALRSKRLARVVVSTDDHEIAETARRYGADVPFMRPAELSQDSTPGLPPVLHALDQLPEHDSVLLLQPTSPLRTADDIDACLRLAEETDAQSVVSVSEPESHPYWTYRLTADRHLAPLYEASAIGRRQDLPPAYALNGALYLADASWLRASRQLVDRDTIGYIMPRERAIDIDTLEDWELAEWRIKRNA